MGFLIWFIALGGRGWVWGWGWRGGGSGAYVGTVCTGRTMRLRLRCWLPYVSYYHDAHSNTLQAVIHAKYIILYIHSKALKISDINLNDMTTNVSGNMVNHG